ncbi:uncharacterized protein Nmlp_2283 [Natronomonas moolapensis 8.8.11]|uniref:Uncharacterized protein n=2 Tax=Natronomonas moolapensis TaxID=416273 RepID=M1XQR7_NATM8|nr:uncharacterized protein Nmlp_2283 [Natronomonas moolapensis 8.8.11]
MSLYAHVRLIVPGMSVSRRDALAAVGRSLGIETSVDDELRTLRAELESTPAAVPSRATARRRVAETAAELEAKRERVAALRGRMQADDGDAGTAYRDAIRTLSEAETEYAAAREALDDARERARTALDDRDRRLRLEDRLGNAERTARRELLSAIRPRVDDAVADAPGSEADGVDDADAVSAALALAKVGRIRRPVVLACGRFPSRDAAERWLGTPAYRIPPQG